MNYKILEIHITKVGSSYKITVAIESSPHRFKAYGTIGTSNEVSEEVFQEIAATGCKCHAETARILVPNLLKHYKYEG